MSFNYNKIQLAGHLTRDPEVKPVGTGSVAKFGLAVNRKWKDGNGETKEEVIFVDVECWGRTAENVGAYLAKGGGAFIEGRLKMDQWTDADGQKRTKFMVVADSVQFLDSKPNGQPAVRQDAPDRPDRPDLAMPQKGKPPIATSPVEDPPF